MKRKDPIIPGSTIGIMGGGQLGRMTAMAAARLGYKCHIYTEEENSPAAQVSAAATVASYTDEEALKAFAKQVDILTFEFENIPHESVQKLSEHVHCRPSWECLHIAQDRIIEKDFISKEAGLPVTPYRKVAGREELDAAIAEIGLPAVLKTARMGYDGKGQVMINEASNLDIVWAEMGRHNGILEGFVDLDFEISVIVARGEDGNIAAFPPAENRHVNHILDVSIAPAPIDPKLNREAVDIAETLAEKMNYVGLLAVEMFVTRQGKVLVNEIAPRPHNSGHWTIDGCITSQFEQFVRAVCGLPLGSPENHSDAIMKNLIGEEALEWERLTAEPGAAVHLYGKREARPGRKMGHVNRIFPKGYHRQS